MTPTGLPPSTDSEIDARGFVASLYDFKFETFVTPKLIRFFYAFFVIVITSVSSWSHRRSGQTAMVSGIVGSLIGLRSSTSCT